jgi:hypothetical protein
VEVERCQNINKYLVNLLGIDFFLQKLDFYALAGNLAKSRQHWEGGQAAAPCHKFFFI